MSGGCKGCRWRSAPGESTCGGCACSAAGSPTAPTDRRSAPTRWWIVRARDYAARDFKRFLKRRIQVLVGCMRVSPERTRSQTADAATRRAARRPASTPTDLYDDHASGRRDDPPCASLPASKPLPRPATTLAVWEARPPRPQPPPPRPRPSTVDRPRRRAQGPRPARAAAIDARPPAAGKLVLRGSSPHWPSSRRELICRSAPPPDWPQPAPRGRKGGRPPKMTAAKLRLSATASMGRPDTNDQRALRRARGHPPDALPTRLPDRRAPTRRAQAPRRRRAQTTMTSRSISRWHSSQSFCSHRPSARVGVSRGKVDVLCQVNRRIFVSEGRILSGGTSPGPPGDPLTQMARCA